MVEKIAKVSSSAPSAATRIDHSVSIAEPDIAWVAKRQSAINAELSPPRANPFFARDGIEADDHHAAAHDLHRYRQASQEAADEQSKALLSGESERIGDGNLEDENVPFGSHAGFV